MRVLVFGGTGVFGSRLCRLLAADPGIVLTIAARDYGAVDALARELGVEGRAFDGRRDLDRVLGEGGHDVVVHIAGPFQYRYAVAELCIRHGVHYVDLADDLAFVRGIDRLAQAALKSNVLVCSGASTAPAITGAVVEEALKVDRSSASPSASCPATMHRVARPWWRQSWAVRAGRSPTSGAGTSGATCVAWGCRDWAGAGSPPATCRSPRCSLNTSAFVTPTAAPGWNCRSCMSGCGRCRGWCAAGLLRSLAPAAPLLVRIADRLRFLGTDRGGLRIELHAGAQSRVWCLIAEGGDGPFIPVIPAAALVRKLARGWSLRGAMPCLGLLTLAEIDAEWRQAGLRIAAGWGADGVELRPSLYRRVLGRAYDGQSRAGQALHDAGSSHWQGRCTVVGAETAVGTLLAWLFQFPAATDDAAIVVEFETSGDGEVWSRRIGGRVMRSRQFIGVRRPSSWIVERFGVLDFDLEVSVAGQRSH